LKDRLLYLTYCSADKRAGVYPPDLLYKSKRISAFVTRCRRLNVDWAILSALYGFFFPDEKKRDYNVTFRTDNEYWLEIAVFENQQKLSYRQSKQHILGLAEKLKEQTAVRLVDNIVFYGPAPKMIKCYLKILHYTFDGCSQSHNWLDLIKHVEAQSCKIKRINRIERILPSIKN
jgi:hypothetical protein